MRRPSLVPAVVAGLTLIMLLLGGCAPAKTPSQALEPGNTSPAAAPRGLHLASLTILELNTDYGVALAVEPQLATFPAGESQFEVLNKWHGLSVGDHVERVRVLAADGRTQVFETQTAFDVTPEHQTLTVIEVIQLTGAPPGTYWIAVDLDGAEITRYTFQLIAVEPGTEAEAP